MCTLPQVFEAECEQKLAQLQDTAAKSQEITCQTNAHDEVDAIHSRWTAVHDQAVQWSTKLGKLVTTWHEFNRLADELTEWLVAREKEVEAPINLNTPDIGKLELELARLKVNCG